MTEPIVIDLLKVFAPAVFAFVFGVTATTPLLRFMHKHKLWKKKSGKTSMDGKDTPLFNELHKNRDSGIPRTGGMVIWISVIATTLFFWFLPHVHLGILTAKLDFLSRNQTWLPLFTLVAASLVGLIDDLMQIKCKDGKSGGLSLRTRILFVLLIGAIGGTWFYLKLGNFMLSVPFINESFNIGAWVVPLFMLVMLALFSGGVIDGIDGLSGGIMATVFASYAGIAFFQNQIDLATFCAVVSGSIIAFLWFNIPPAVFYMGESGMLGLTTALSVVAFLTQHVVELPIIALPLFIASGSDIIQVLSKKIRGKKVFLIAPIHHHFEALGWPSYRVTMRFWIVGIMAALTGMIIALAS